MNITRTISLRPKEGGTFDLVLQTRDAYSHSALTTLPKSAEDRVQAIITDSLLKICGIIEENTDWRKIGK